MSIIKNDDDNISTCRIPFGQSSNRYRISTTLNHR